jgi:hypothetical protein
MPSPLRIPDRYQPGLRALAELPDDQAERLQAALTQMPARLATSRLTELVTDAIPEPPGKVRDVLEAVLSLAALLEDDGDTAELSRDVSLSPDLELDDAGRERFRERVRRLLDLEPVQLASRARDVVTEYERVFHDARVLTDLRPVFGRDAQAGAKAATVVATLKIEAHEGTGPLSEYYFAMDHGDLLRLRAMVDRALAKTAAIKRLADRMDLPYWEYEEVDDATDS